MVITLEGVPAVGKSTVAKLLEEKHGFFRVPEVNELFPKRPSPEPLDWYSSKQVERSNIAIRYPKSILDGDIFQVVWFGWIYPKRGFVNYIDALDLFMGKASSINLPSLFVYLSTTAEMRYEREKKREAERGHNHQQFLNKYKRYEDMYLPQQALFDAINEEFPGWVLFINNENSENTAIKVAAEEPENVPSVTEFIVWLKKWLSLNSPRRFSENTP